MDIRAQILRFLEEATSIVIGSSKTETVQVTGSMQVTGFAIASGMANYSDVIQPITIPQKTNSVLYGPIRLGEEGELSIPANTIVKIKDISDA